MDLKRYYDKVGELGIKDSDFKRFDFVYNHILPKKDLLDVGCGCGEWLEYLLEKNENNLAGCDISKVRLESAKESLKNKVSLSLSDILSLDYVDNSFKQTTALETIEHIPEWKKGINELLRVSSERVVITVPYDENLKFEICNCGEKAYLYGHLHSFKEKDFDYLKKQNLNLSFEKIKNPKSSEYYVKRLLNFISRKTKPEKEKSTSGHSNITICPSCYEKVPYSKYYERMRDRVFRIMFNKPEYLLVELNKN